MKWVKRLEKNGIYDKMSIMKPLVICVYLASLIQEGVSVSVLSSALYGIRWAYSVIGISSPTDSELVKNVYEAGKRRLSVPITKKEPINSDMLRKMHCKLFESENIYNQRTICACLVAYSGFLRCSELLNIRCLFRCLF